ncbi:MAG TPA: hypothetical protein VMR21_12420, partial [Vicinamibacteria bacterium]|nr:hypothetical protein [Vicinamibacteria bacterium]
EAGALAAARKTAENAVEPEAAAPPRGGRLGAVSLGEARPDAGGEARFRMLAARSAEDAVEARALREAWTAFAAQRPSDPRADEARVRAIEAGLQAWRLGGDPADLETARAAAEAYLASPAALQKERVRRALATVPSPSSR